MFLMMNKNIARNMWSSQGITNYPKELRLVGHFRTLYYDEGHAAGGAVGCGPALPAGRWRVRFPMV
jgi:hypothetical protein